MEIDEDILNLGAIFLELGIPTILIFLSISSAQYRRSLLPILGSITFVVVGYMYILVGYFVIDRKEYEYAYYTVWIMSLFIYIVMIAAGITTAVIIRNKYSNAVRYFIGMIAGGLTLVAFWAIQ